MYCPFSPPSFILVALILLKRRGPGSEATVVVVFSDSLCQSFVVLTLLLIVICNTISTLNGEKYFQWSGPAPSYQPRKIF